MGNKHSRNKSTSDSSTGSPKRRKKERGSKRGSVTPSIGETDHKHKSMPELGRDKKEEEVKFTMHRSYRSVSRSWVSVKVMGHIGQCQGLGSVPRSWVI